VITLRLRDTARVPEDVLTTAQGGVTRIYCDAGVETVWLTPELLSTESNEARQAALTVAIVSIALGTVGPGQWSLDDAFGFSFPFDPDKALLITALVGIGGAAAFLGAFWRPPKSVDSGS